jgi:hypothetical protein
VVSVPAKVFPLATKDWKDVVQLRRSHCIRWPCFCCSIIG